MRGMTPRTLASSQVSDWHTHATSGLPIPGRAGPYYRDLVAINNPVVYWRFNETGGTTVKDYFRTGTTTFPISGPSLDVVNATSLLQKEPMNDRSWDVTGAAAAVSPSNSATFQRPLKFTLEVWINLDSVSRGTVIAKESAWILRVWDGKIEWIMVDPAYGTTRSTTTIAVGQTYYIATTWDGANSKLYVNGVLEDTYNGSGVSTGNGFFTIGSMYFPTTAAYRDLDYMDGRIDELAIYDKVLSSDTFLQHYQVGTADVSTPIAGTQGVGTVVAKSISDPGFNATRYIDATNSVNVRLWLDARYMNGLTGTNPSDNTTPSTWTDNGLVSLHGTFVGTHTFYSSTLTTPTGKPVVHFNGGYLRLLTNPVGYSMGQTTYIVFSRNGYASDTISNVLFDSGIPTTTSTRYGFNTSSQLYQSSGATLTGQTISTTNWEVVAFRNNGTDSRISRLGSIDVVGNAGNLGGAGTGYTVCADDDLTTGYNARILLACLVNYTAFHSAATRKAVMDDLAATFVGA